MVLRSFTWMIGQFYKKGNEYFGVFNPVFLKFSFLFVVLLGNVVIFESIESAVERREKKKKNFYEILLRDISSLMPKQGTLQLVSSAVVYDSKPQIYMGAQPAVSEDSDRLTHL
ncbi:uncharacterized protein LOC135161053 isoform X3 [Diachasmimorpha longicaudata]|uniref:uncharacterized protein LOC135161053 isoform X3 n=1 Tax=Diachasmimorpha longicaudata TaxID=58733 RepID=UPI0030B86A34